MTTLVVYDISDDNIRNKLAEFLKDNGLERIQKSAFIGDLTPQERRDLVRLLHYFIKDENDRIDVFVICEKDMKLHEVIRFL